MKAKRISEEPTFKPIAIEITLETEFEVKTMFHLFNRNIPCLAGFDPIRAAIGMKFYNEDFHKNLWADIKESVDQK